MRRKPLLGLMLLSGILLASVSLPGRAADEKAEKAKAKAKLKEQRVAAKKAAEAKKAADEKAAAEKERKEAEARRAAAEKIQKEREAKGESVAKFKPAKIGGDKDAIGVARFIDSHIDAKLAAEKVPASPASTDEEFLRRAYLDITGVIPTAEQAKSFLDSHDPAKRAKLVDELLESPNYGRHRADLWMGILVERTSDNRRVNFDSLRKWLAEQFAANKPWDAMVSDILTATGDQEKNPAVGFFLSNNTVDKMTDETAKAFLGVQLQCAQCHDHKFNDWKQTEYWAMAQFFMKVQVGGLGKDQTPGIQETQNVRRNKMNPLPESAKSVEPKFLQGEHPTVAKSEPYRPVLAKWMTAPTNPFFAKAMTNRVWAELFGRGIVNPVDDMVGQNLPSHPELLEGLAADFAANGFDVKHLIRSICNSAAYARSSKSVGGNETAAPHLYAKRSVRVLSAEQLFDSLAAVTKFQDNAKAREKGMKAGPAGARERFVNFFLAGAEMVNPVEYEAGIPQALKLMNSRQTGAANPAIVRAVVGTARGTEAIEKIYLAALSRRPTPAESDRLAKYLDTSGGLSQDALGDVVWAVLNSSEFTLNR
ncbi:MAG: DUF1549 domain-containing protein [Planctomycetia bacterium]|nr:DUF1549 domain-containing protein [Planctomycetia bacterium]